VPLLSELRVGSLLIYPTRGTSEASQKAYEFVRYGIKHARPVPITHSIKRLRESLRGSSLKNHRTELGVLVQDSLRMYSSCAGSHPPRWDRQII
jgi:hypothetical protein